MKYYTGGKGLPGVMNMCEFEASAVHINDPLAVPPYTNADGSNNTVTPIPGGNLWLGGMGRANANGVVARLLVNNATNDISVYAVSESHMASSNSATKYVLNSQCLDNHPANKNRTDIGVGETVNLWMTPPAPSGTVWTVTNNPKGRFDRTSLPSDPDGGVDLVAPYLKTLASGLGGSGRL